ncbi:DUF445 family protein [Alkalihalobacillus sp. LMS39]|uniref:DUF445 domain-containing protein n=1 Tax=Alkalihalobacillus sp. LMS39 TaxID=2924032 RepID=UPI001FB1AE94|nr:DUF445 family protein [Alkalihalobacillus sp. LMS39]UOE95473.1 DUF445 family protein [Alkalihalobacillus sp. LMS39]
MNTFLLLIMMMTIGAVIGGVTNSLAIKMLFRPYRPIYIGRFRVPFTPGLIPKRRGELAEQLGKMVVTHLLTAEGIQKKLTDSLFRTEMTAWAEEEIKRLLHAEGTLEQFASDYLGVEELRNLAEAKTERMLTEKWTNLKAQLADKELSEVLPVRWQEKIEGKLPVIADMITQKGAEYFQSQEGKARLSIMIDRFLVGKGTLGNMISMFLGQDRLVDKVQPEIIKFLQDKGARDLIVTLLEKEWAKLKTKKMNSFYEFITDDDVVPFVQNVVVANIPVYNWLNTPVKEWAPVYEDTIVQMIPKTVLVFSKLITDRIEMLLKKLHLEDVVKSQVETFAVARLEELVLSISRREFKMITYLGALLGGLIGIVQGIIVLFLS